jgi:hypothetical protein
MEAHSKTGKLEIYIPGLHSHPQKLGNWAPGYVLELLGYLGAREINGETY